MKRRPRANEGDDYSGLMPFNDSTRGVIQDVLADDAEPADYPVQIAAIVNAIEPNLVLKADTVTTANTTLAPLVEGMILITTGAAKEVYVRQGTAWVKIHPNTYAGTAAPAGTLGINGDVYFQYA
jgi:hypothetical protein